MAAGRMPRVEVGAERGTGVQVGEIVGEAVEHGMLDKVERQKRDQRPHPCDKRISPSTAAEPGASLGVAVETVDTDERGNKL